MLSYLKIYIMRLPMERKTRKYSMYVFFRTLVLFALSCNET